MKRINKVFFVIIFGTALVLVITCSDNPTKTIEREIELISYQIPGCQDNSLSKLNSFDSLFTYSFTDTLNINLGVWGNCGPDTNRFSTSYNITNDTIFITVQDTAINMYWCLCDYIVNIKLIGLPNDKYFISCTFPENTDDWKTIKYREFVVRE